NRIKSWGGPSASKEYEWPAQPAGIAVAPNGNVWTAGTGGLDAHMLVFTHDGAFVRQIGKAGQAPAAPTGGPDTAYQGVSPGGRGAVGAAGAGAAGGR